MSMILEESVVGKDDFSPLAIDDAAMVAECTVTMKKIWKRIKRVTGRRALRNRIRILGKFSHPSLAFLTVLCT